VNRIESKPQEVRPDIFAIQKGKELKRWYWLKEELVNYCKVAKLNYEGAKFDILNRIADKLDGRVAKHATTLKNSKTAIDLFDWSKEPLTLKTKITDSYRNGPHVRKFFIEHCGVGFHFSIPFMQWMKENVGKNLKTSVKEWNRLQVIKKNKGFKSSIPAGNQYNQYLRDFFRDNPDKKITDARLCWKMKRQLPLERHRYERSDLRLILNIVHTSSKTKRKN
jgi:Domain of unknown function (DUF6434)/SAP domain-containing new25